MRTAKNAAAAGCSSKVRLVGSASDVRTSNEKYAHEMRQWSQSTGNAGAYEMCEIARRATSEAPHANGKKSWIKIAKGERWHRNPNKSAIHRSQMPIQLTRCAAPQHNDSMKNSQFLCIYLRLWPEHMEWHAMPQFIRALKTRHKMRTEERKCRERMKGKINQTRKKIIFAVKWKMGMHVWQRNLKTACTTSTSWKTQTQTHTHAHARAITADSRSNYTYFCVAIVSAAANTGRKHSNRTSQADTLHLRDTLRMNCVNVCVCVHEPNEREQRENKCTCQVKRISVSVPVERSRRTTNKPHEKK